MSNISKPKVSQVEYTINALQKGTTVKDLNLAMLKAYENMNNCPIIYRVIRALNGMNIKVSTDHAELAKGKVLRGQNDLLRVSARVRTLIAEEKAAKKGRK